MTNNKPMAEEAMNNQFIAFHTMIRGSGKPQYIVGCARALAEKGAKILILDGLMYEQCAIPHQFYQMLDTSPVIPKDGNNLYDLIFDYETICDGNETPPKRIAKDVEKRLTYPVTRMFRKHVFPDVCGRVSPVPGYRLISYLAGNNGNVVEIRERIDFHELFESHCGYEFFEYIREQLTGEYDFILLNAPAGHQEISGIFCGHMADIILAIDIDSPSIEDDPSFQTCRKLAQRIQDDGLRQVCVKSVKGHDLEEVVEMILEGKLSTKSGCSSSMA